MADLSGAVWHKSTRSGGNGGDCVEVATNLPGIVALRDTKDPDGAALVFTRAEWLAFLDGVRAGEFDI
ncbi:DUF397 domain-containing protein [Actinoplanes siamensis]|uniref:DUF397 domain-containing protein n=1 Tax=Actinoplanes siamensis TaxID=1223317 RepID=A0A919NC28_9ACTN|nr:DUF397 domain-containing protein [Actinoplanes siamensis]GIF08116.1 hypothetical protein Asi03nite_56540 [Actinoplanes siamensis]